MQKKHKHYDVIVAWAEGQKVQYRTADYVSWVDTENPWFAPEHQWRVKPKNQVIKHRRWLYCTGQTCGISLCEFQEHYNPEVHNPHFIKWIDENWVEYEVTE